MKKKTNNTTRYAYALTGGGARSCHSSGVMKGLREKGYKPTIIAGTSGGNLVGALEACELYNEQEIIWKNITPKQVYNLNFIPFNLLFGDVSIANNDPLYKLIKKYIKDASQFKIPFISVITDYLSEDSKAVNIIESCKAKADFDIAKVILASAAIPIFFKPTKMYDSYYIDGGVLENNPITALLNYEDEFDEVIIIATGDFNHVEATTYPKNIIEYFDRVYDIMERALFTQSMKRFEDINNFVKQAEAQGVTLINEKTGKPYKYIPYQVVIPNCELPSTIEFNAKKCSKGFDGGYKQALEQF